MILSALPNYILDYLEGPGALQVSLYYFLLANVNGNRLLVDKTVLKIKDEVSY